MGKWTLTPLNCVPYFILTPFLEAKETLAVLTPYWKRNIAKGNYYQLYMNGKLKIANF